ncbi:uncharacterized protein G2W53_029332 [Senna tora]|uniref:Uncharacterized protein n=1 Tax=Senna tora TaxID=362788 RepID=A0A834T2T4_9FABA|nr:uncharacterized protein G2W53_029332 [Senna tora]
MHLSLILVKKRDEERRRLGLGWDIRRYLQLDGDNSEFRFPGDGYSLRWLCRGQFGEFTQKGVSATWIVTIIADNEISAFISNQAPRAHLIV